MTHTNRMFALAYLLLVILPVLGLAGVLRSGRNLVAPISGRSKDVQFPSPTAGLTPFLPRL